MAKTQLLEQCVSPEGWFYASSAQNVGIGNFNCLFGRDACITSLLTMEYAKATGDRVFLPIIRRTLEKLADTAGRNFDRQTSEKPGWIIHELRTDNHEHLTAAKASPWPIGEDGVMRIYESIDSTPLYLIAVYRYYEIVGDEAWLASQVCAVKNALKAVLKYGDCNGDGLIDYTVPVERTCGGLVVQSWMDSTESFEGPLIMPVAPLEVQGYVWLAFRLWADYFTQKNLKWEFAYYLSKFAAGLSLKVWDSFRGFDEQGSYLAANINGYGRPTVGARSSMGHLLWAVTIEQGVEGVLGKLADYPNRYDTLVKQLLDPAMFDPAAGIRTLSVKATHYNPKKYHNGTIWPHDNALIYLGLYQCGFKDEASQVANAVFKALEHFGAPGMELYWHTSEGYGEYRHKEGNFANRVQAWALAGTLAMAALEGI